MRVTFWHILATAFILIGLAYYCVPFVRYLLIPFSGGTKAPESLMIRFFGIHAAIDTQNHEQIFSDSFKQVDSIDAVPEQGGWINSSPLALDQLYAQNKCILINFWSLSCMKCLRSIPYLQELWDYYKDYGLMVIGVHSPVFNFEKDPHAILYAIKRAHITYPVMTDAQKKTWEKFGNYFLPGMYLINPQGIIKYTNFGEGNYAQMEHAIREVLKKAGRKVPPVKAATTYLDPIIRRSTQELYAGAHCLRKPYGTPEQPQNKQTILFTLPSKIDPDKLYIEGMYQCGSDYVQNKTEGKIIVNYLANAPYFVLAPTDAQKTIFVEVLLDNQPLPADIKGIDIKEVEGKYGLLVDQARIYYPIVHRAPYGRHTITLVAQPGLRFYSALFGTY